MITEARIEEAISVGMAHQIHAVYLSNEVARIKNVVKYSSQESAPSQHGLFVEFDSGETFEITIRRQ
jgi:hypothetical protein